MFINFCVKNFLSLENEHCIDFGITKSQHIDDTSITINDSFINKIGSLVGPNASGKTNILKAFVAFTQFIENSYLVHDIAIEPHFFHKKEDIVFSTNFIEDDGEQFNYSITINQNKIIHEQLRILNKKTKFYNNVFVRKGNNVDSDVIKINDLDKGRLGDMVSAFSFFQKLNYFTKSKIQITSFCHILTNVDISSVIKSPIPQIVFLDQLAKELEKRPDLLAKVVDEVKNVDFGISNLKTVVLPTNPNLPPDKNMKLLMATHEDGKNTTVLPLFLESSGTQNYILLFGKIYDILRTGGILVADELENSLHTDLVERILTLFIRKETNPHNAQILFSTHNAWFLRFLTKTQIFIVEKDAPQSTDIYRLDDIKEVRNDENYFLNYIAGAYDGKPKIKDLL